MFNEYVTYKGKKYYSLLGGALNFSKAGIEAIKEIEGLEKLTTIRELDLKSNLITKIEGLEKLSSLWILNLENNLIMELKGLDSLVNLKELHLSGNMLKEIKNLEKFKKLETLNLNYNKISEIKGLENLNNLKKLSLKGNLIQAELIEALGGLDKNGFAKNPQAFVKYCQNLKKNQQKITDASQKLQKMLAISTRVKLDLARKTLNIDENIFSQKIWDWAEQFNFIIDGDYLIKSETTEQKTASSLKEPEAVKIGRGGEVVGGKLIYKVKIQNLSNFNITDVAVHLISFPRVCLQITTPEFRTVPKIEPNGFRSLEFEFEPQKDCVEGTIHASISYIDHRNKSSTATVEAYVIRYVCDLLNPYKINEAEFDTFLLDWQKTDEYIKIYENINFLLQRCEKTLEQNNFFIISSRIVETADNQQAKGVIKAFAKGKYGGKKIGLLVEILGDKDGDLSKLRTSSISEDEAMLAPPISEVMETLNKSGISLEKLNMDEQALFIKEKLIHSLKHIVITDNQSGIPLYSLNFGHFEMDPALLSGFLSAISSFGSELVGGTELGIKKMVYESMKILMQKGSNINVGLIIDDFPEEWLEQRLKLFINTFEAKYKDALARWDGETTPFETVGSLFNDIFEIS